MKYKFVKHWSGMVLYIYAKGYRNDWTKGYWESVPYNYWRKATDTEAYEIMCKLNKEGN